MPLNNLCLSELKVVLLNCQNLEFKDYTRNYLIWFIDALRMVNNFHTMSNDKIISSNSSVTIRISLLYIFIWTICY